MALNLNFYHELHKEEYERARDPLKLASKAAFVVLALAAIYYLYRLKEVSVIAKEAARLRADWAKLEPAKKQAEAREEELLKGQQTHKALIERLQGRFLWAPVLAQLQEAMSPDIQLQLLMAETTKDGIIIKPEMQLVGVAAGLQPRSVAEEFRLRLQNVLALTYDTVIVRYEGTNSLEETADIVETANGSLGVARFRLRVVLGKPKNEAAQESTEEAPPKEEAAASQSLPAREIAKARATLEGVAKARNEMENEFEGTMKTGRNAAEVARQKGKR